MKLTQLILAPFLAVSTICAAQVQIPGVAVGPKEVSKLQPPVVASGPGFSEVSWSASGKYLVFTRTRSQEPVASLLDPTPLRATTGPSGTSEVVVYSLISKRSVVLASADAGLTYVQLLGWVGNSDSVLVATFTGGQGPGGAGPKLVSSYSLISAANGKITPVFSFDEDQSYSVFAISNLNVGAVATTPLVSREGSDVMRQEVRFFGLDGKIGPTIKLPENARLCSYEPFPGVFARQYVRDAKTRRASVNWLRIDPKSGAVSPCPQPKEIATPETSGPAIVEGQFSGQQSNLKATAKTLWLRYQGAKESEATVVTTDGEYGEIAPGGGAMSYRSQGQLLVRLIQKFSRSDYDLALAQYAREQAVVNSKQLGLGFAMMAADYDGVLPANDSDWQNKIGPYMKDASLASQFKYTFAGGEIGKVKDPAGTVLGYIAAPGGRAVCFIDGHVQWVPNP